MLLMLFNNGACRLVLLAVARCPGRCAARYSVAATHGRGRGRGTRRHAASGLCARRRGRGRGRGTRRRAASGLCARRRGRGRGGRGVPFR